MSGSTKPQPAAQRARQRADAAPAATARARYRRRSGQPITAIQLTLETPGLSYRKWGGEQVAKPGDWLVDNDGEVYSVDAESFARTYRAISPGRFEKHGHVYAVRADTHGRVATKEGFSTYAPGDWLVSNDAEGRDVYAVDAAAFARMYEPDDEASG